MQKLVFSLCLLFVTFFINVNGQVIYRTDSIIYNGEMVKYVYQYDQYGNKTSQTESSYNDIDSKWYISNKKVWKYDENVNLIFRGEYIYYKNTSSWNLFDGEKSEYEYDENNNIISFKFFDWDYSSSTWKISRSGLSKFEYEYDDNYDIISTAKYDWISTYSLWEGDFKIDSIYDSQSNTSIFKSYEWDNNEQTWKNYYKKEYILDNDMKIVSSITSYWNSIKSVWEISSKCEYTYDLNNKQLSNESFSWDSNASLWVNNKKEVSTYDIVGNITSYAIFFDWSENDLIWGYHYKENYYYSNNFSTKETRECSWNANLNEWRETDTTYTENISAFVYFPINSDTRYIPLTTTGSWTVSSDVPWLSFSPSSGTGKDTIYVTAQENPSGNSRTGSITITCDSEFGLKGASTQTITVTQAGVYTTGIKEQTKSTVDLFPNPSSSYFKVRTEGVATVSVFSIKGELVLCTKVEDNQAISTERLNKGMYLVKIENSDGTFTKRLVVK